MVAIYADNLARLRSDYFRVLRDVVPPCGQWYTIIMTPSVTFVIALATSKASGPSASSTSSRMVDSSASSVENTRTTHASSTNETVEMDEVPCGAHIMKQPLIHSDTDCRTRRRKRADGSAKVAAAGSSRVKGICRAYDLREKEGQPERPYISFTPTEVHPTAATAAEQSHKAAT